MAGYKRKYIIENSAAQDRAMQECNLSGAARLKAGQGAYGAYKLPAFVSPRPDFRNVISLILSQKRNFVVCLSAAVAKSGSANLMRCRALLKVVAIQPALAGKAINSARYKGGI